MSIRVHGTEWRRPIGSLKSQVIFRKRATNYRALLRKMTYKDNASYDSTPLFITWDVLQCVAIYCSVWRCGLEISVLLSCSNTSYLSADRNTLQHIATHCNTLQYIPRNTSYLSADHPVCASASCAIAACAPVLTPQSL